MATGEGSDSSGMGSPRKVKRLYGAKGLGTGFTIAGTAKGEPERHHRPREDGQGDACVGDELECDLISGSGDVVRVNQGIDNPFHRSAHAVQV